MPSGLFNISKIKNLPPWLPVVLLLVLHFTLAATAVYHKSPTFDEPPYLAGGIAAWTEYDFRINPENGILPQLIQGIPASLTGGYQPFTESDLFRANKGMAASQYALFSPGIDYQTLFFHARCMTIILSVVLALTIYFFSRKLYGHTPALVSLAFYALCPLVIAHAALTTADLAVTLFFTLSIGLLAMVLRRATSMRILALCLAATALCLSKFSCILFPPMAFLLVVACAFIGPVWRVQLPFLHVTLHKRAAKCLAGLALLVFVGAVAWAAIWATYGLRYQAPNPRFPDAVFNNPESWTAIKSQLTPTHTRFINFLQDHKLLPEAYIFGLCSSIGGAQRRSTFFLGQVDTYGRPAYFPTAYLLKTPTAILLTQAIALIVGLVAWARLLARHQRRRLWARFYATLPWWLLITFLGTICLTSSLNIGLRHLLPIVPAMFILAGSLARQLTLRHRPIHIASNVSTPQGSGHLLLVNGTVRIHTPVSIALLLVITFADTLWAWPNYINYYTPLIGGTNQGYRYLGDSNTDWGQDLPALADFAKTKNLHADADDTPGPDAVPARLYFSYFGSVPLQSAGIDCNPLYCFLPTQQYRNLRAPLLPGYYAYGCTPLQRLYSPIYAWTDDKEKIYRRYTLLFQELNNPSNTPEQLAKLRTVMPENAEPAALSDLNTLRSIRLAMFLSRIEPDFQLNGSINIYCLDQAELDKYLYSDPP